VNRPLSADDQAPCSIKLAREAQKWKERESRWYK